MTADDEDERKVGLLLGAGIFFFPYIFAWFTLREGYSQVARTVSFAWLGLIVFAALIVPHTAKGPDAARTVSNAEATQGIGQLNSASSGRPAAKVFSAAERAAALGKMRVEKDKVEGTTWYYDKTTSKYLDANSFYIYLSQATTPPPGVRLHIQYSASDWIFFQTILVKADDQTFKFLAPDPQRHVNEGSVSEWVDVPVDTGHVPMLLAVADAKNVTVRLTGPQFQKDRQLSPNEKRAFRNVLNAYHALGGTEF